jgi:hypothetical protein
VVAVTGDERQELRRLCAYPPVPTLLDEIDRLIVRYQSDVDFERNRANEKAAESATRHAEVSRLQAELEASLIAVREALDLVRCEPMYLSEDEVATFERLRTRWVP